MLHYLTGLNDQDLKSEIEQLDPAHLPDASRLKHGVLFKGGKIDNSDIETFVSTSSQPLSAYSYNNLPGQWLLHFPMLTAFELFNTPWPSTTDDAQATGLSAALQQTIAKLRTDQWEFAIGDRQLTLGPPMIMGILNVTPDSFSDGGKYLTPKAAIERATAMAANGATIVDIGGESSRPGASPVPEDEEWRRIGPVIKEISEKTDLIISVDTYKSNIARKAFEAGAHLINDISGMTLDKEMIDVVAAYQAPVVLMHMQNQPQNMQDNPTYHNLMDEIRQSLADRIAMAEQRGIRKIIIDPGIGFGKRLADNFEIIRRLGEFKSLGYPLLVGVSRKKFLRESLSVNTEGSLIGSITASLVSLLNGAQIVRVHDVAEMQQAITTLSEIERRKAS